MAMSQPTPDVTELLRDWNRGHKEALDRLMPLITEELRVLARRHLRQERSGHTLQPTALVNEVYLRLLGRRQASWEDRVHFFSFAARTMRRILVDHARGKRSAKRGGGVTIFPLDEANDAATAGPEIDVIALDRALTELAELDERQARLVELRYFAGLTLAETAIALEISEATVSRDWLSAKAWLHRALSAEIPHRDP